MDGLSKCLLCKFRVRILLWARRVVCRMSFVIDSSPIYLSSECKGSELSVVGIHQCLHDYDSGGGGGW